MKKLTAILLVLVLAVSLVMLPGCGDNDTPSTPGNEQPGTSGDDPAPAGQKLYGSYDLGKYVTLPNYNAYKITRPQVNVSDADIDKEIKARAFEEITTGTAENGDVIIIGFEGRLADGTSVNGMSAERYELTLGSGGLIPGFEEGIAGKNVGDKVTLNLKFPNPYDINPDLAGKDCIFDVTILAKKVPMTELTQEFIDKDSNGQAKDEAEYREFIKEKLYLSAYQTALSEAQLNLYYQIRDNTIVSSVIDKEVKNCKNVTKEFYSKVAEQQGMTWEAFLNANLGMTPDEYDKELDNTAKSSVKDRMIICALADAEDVLLDTADYQQNVSTFLSSYGYSNEAEFKDQMGITVDDYMDLVYQMRYNLLLTDTIEKIYDRIAK